MFFGASAARSCPFPKRFAFGLVATVATGIGRGWRFYPVAILFLVFDIEVAFLYPWAINYASLSCAEPLVKGTCQAGVSWLGVGTVGFFMAVLLVALAYVWRKRAIGWD